VTANAHVRSRKIGPILVVITPDLETMELKDDLPLLNDLRDLLVAGREGHVKAAKRVADEHLKVLLVHLGTGRTQLLKQLDQLRLTADPKAGMRNRGTFKGDLHRSWTEIREALSKSDNAHVLGACERVEEYLRKRYADVEQEEVDPRTFQLCQRHMREVIANVMQIQDVARTFGTDPAAVRDREGSSAC
jgi:uncharacterized protein (TIGR02284 family)